MALPATDTARTAAQSVIDIFAFNQGLITKALMTAQEESLNFVNQRLECNRQTIEKARNARGLDSFLTVQREWMIDSARDYLQQSVRFADRLMELAERGEQESEAKAQATSDSFRAAVRSDTGKARESFRQAASTTKATFEASKAATEKASE